MNIYNLVSGKIGLKKLTGGDMGSPTTHLTHIGLYESTLSHLPYERKAYNGQLIYNKQSFEGMFFLKFINNNRSPAINFGSKLEQKELPNNVISIGKTIREIANTNRNVSWFLIWFALDNDEIITIIFNQNSEEYSILSQIGIDLERRHTISEDEIDYNSVASFVNNLTTTVNLEYISELETISQTGEMITKRIIPITRDIEKANKLFKETGKKGEELVNQYLKLQKNNQFIKDFTWVNKSRETGFPYDFEITKNDNSIFFSDSKATSLKFKQPIILSTGELQFINQNKENYLIYRVYSVFDEPKLRICNNIHKISDIFMPNYNTFNTNLRKEKLTPKINLSVPTNLEIITFENEILLNANA